MLAGSLDGTWREGKPPAAECSYNLLRINALDVPLAKELLNAFWSEFGRFGGRGRQLDERPNPRLVGSSRELKHVRIVATEYWRSWQQWR